MTINILRGSSLRLKFGSSTTTGDEAEKCMLNLTRSFSVDASFTEDPVQDCDNPENPATIYRYPASVGFTLDGTGKFDGGSLDFFMDWVESGSPRACKILIDLTGAQGGQLITCQVVLTKFAVTGEPHKNAEASMSFASHGAWTRTNNA